MTMREIRQYGVHWWHGGVTESSGDSPVAAVRLALGPSAAKRVYRIGSIARGKTAVQIIWPNGTGEQVDVWLRPKKDDQPADRATEDEA